MRSNLWGGGLAEWLPTVAIVGAAFTAGIFLTRLTSPLARVRRTAVGIIPARYASSRFEGKPLALILGKPMIQRTWEQAKLAMELDHVVVATDDDRIIQCCRAFGAEVIATSETCANGTERCYEALTKLGRKFDIVVNIQGDEPLIDPDIIDGVVQALKNSPDAKFSTAVTALKPEQCYDAGFLGIYPQMAPTPLQLEEDLEQLKVLENGYRMKIIKVDHDAHGVDTPSDIQSIEALMKARHLK